MKKLLKISIMLIILSISTVYSGAVTRLNPKATVKLPKEAFSTDLAVYNKYIYYFTLDNKLMSYKTYSKSVFTNEKARQINNIQDAYTIKIPVFKVLSDNKLYSIARYGGGFMGGLNIYQLSRDKYVPMGDASSSSVDIDSINNKIESDYDPYYMNQGKVGSWYTSFDNDIVKETYTSEDILRMAPLFSSITKDYTYMVNYQYNNTYDDDYGESNSQESDLDAIKAPGIVSINSSNDKMEMLIPNVQNMVMGSDRIYYCKKESGKDLYSIYSYSLKNKSTELICSSANFVSGKYNIFPVKNNIFFMGGNENSKLFTVANKKPKLLASNMSRVVTNGNVVAVLSQYKNKSEVRILNEKGVQIADISVPNSQSDMFIYKNELIVWSWQDRSVRYYDISIK